MHYFKNEQGQVYAYENSEDAIEGLEAIDEADALLLANPPPTDQQLAAQALAQRDQLLREASAVMAPLQYAIDLGEASETEKAALIAWKRYCIALNRIEQQQGFPKELIWPIAPVVGATA